MRSCSANNRRGRSGSSGPSLSACVVGVLPGRWRSWLPRPSGVSHRLRLARSRGHGLLVRPSLHHAIGESSARLRPAHCSGASSSVGRPMRENGWPAARRAPLHLTLCPHLGDPPGLHCRCRCLQRCAVSIFGRKSEGSDRLVGQGVAPSVWAVSSLSMSGHSLLASQSR